MKMEKIYPNADLKLVNKIVVYSDDAEPTAYLYPNAECNEDEKLDGETLMNLLMMGTLLVVYDGGSEMAYKIVSNFTDHLEDGYVEIGAFLGSSGYAYYSSEYAPSPVE